MSIDDEICFEIGPLFFIALMLSEMSITNFPEFIKGSSGIFTQSVSKAGRVQNSFVPSGMVACMSVQLTHWPWELWFNNFRI